MDVTFLRGSLLETCESRAMSSEFFLVARTWQLAGRLNRRKSGLYISDQLLW